MARIGESGDLIKCSFCGKGQKQVRRMVAGPGVYICNECVALCCEIFEEEGLVSEGEYKAGSDPQHFPSGWIDAVERQETVKLVDEAKKTLEQLLNLLNLQHSDKDS